MASSLASGILSLAIKEMMAKKDTGFALGYLESVLSRVLDDNALNKVNNELIDGVKNL